MLTKREFVGKPQPDGFGSVSSQSLPVGFPNLGLDLDLFPVKAFPLDFQTWVALFQIAPSGDYSPLHFPELHILDDRFTLIIV
jgi:hypothetical protein